MHHQTIRHHRPTHGTLDITDPRQGRTIRCRDIQFTYQEDGGTVTLIQISAMAVAIDAHGQPERRGLLRRANYRPYLLQERALAIPEIGEAARQLRPNAAGRPSRAASL